MMLSVLNHEATAKEGITITEAVEEIDIGGVTLLRAAAKNHDRMTLSDPNDYQPFLIELKKDGCISENSRRLFALKAFNHTTMMMQFQIILDKNILKIFLNSLYVMELKAALNLPAADSFKHISPAGVAPLDDIEKRFGVSTAKIISCEVSDDVIAPGYDAQALKNFKQKEGWKIHCNSAITDLIFASITLKYTQSNSVCYAKNGMVIGLGLESTSQESNFNTIPEPLTPEKRKLHLVSLSGVALSSDAFFYFPGNIHRANQSGADYVAAPSGSVQDQAVIQAADKHGMVLIQDNFIIKIL
ncbi:Bifunctional purine biosynthesis protein ADE17 [Gigaspora margarita]|uniref:Bifunctional purine biosynthesis protein ADE17 n=1 Tax=Gigaspora margarita TaxID=4874 RepID=A0A8H3XI21_GIGMA|nr:Bifunctional purine biosynthesis protein ADE17 [Gigaspora margarita]